MARRLISDSILVAYEALYVMDAQMIKRREEYITFKLDMSKVYDHKVECDFFRPR
jgi:hypothetical protein